MRNLAASLFLFLAAAFSLAAADEEAAQREVLKYGTDNEITELIKTLKKENVEYLDDDLSRLVSDTKNPVIKSQIMTFFADREKKGLEKEAVALVENREDMESVNVLAALEYLSKTRYPAAQGALRALLESGEDQYMPAAIKAIGGAVDDKNAGDTAEYLINYYENKNPPEQYQQAIILALGETGSKKAARFLSALVTQNERAGLTIPALAALGKIAGNDAVEVITGALSSKDPNIRASAVEALGSFSGGEVESALLDAFRDSYYKTRLAAVKAAGKRKLKDAIPYLKFRAEKDEVPAVREEALRSLAEIGTSECARIIEAVFDDKKSPDRLKSLAAKSLIETDADAYAEKIMLSLDEAKRLNQKQLYSGLMAALSKAKTGRVKPLVGRLFASKDAVDKAYALELTALNRFDAFRGEVDNLATGEKSGLSRKAKEVLATLN
jgi:HEAT repeat protein